MLYKFVGFAYLLFNLGPYLVEFSQTVNELLVLKSFQDRSWSEKSKLNKFCQISIISPVGPYVVVLKILLRLAQGVSVLIMGLAVFDKEKDFKEKKISIDNLFDSGIEQNCGEQPQSK